MTSLRAWRLTALLFAALSLGMKLAHAFETPGKLELDAETFLVAQTTLYDLFAVIGPVLDLGALVSVGVLAWLSRGLPSFRWVAVTFGLVCASLLTWAIVVMPAAASIREWAETPGVIPADWESLRNAWQFGQLATFGLELIGFVSLSFAVTFRSTTPTPSK